METRILNKLKGFVHKHIDLPYNVETRGKSSRAQSILFSKRVKVLVDDILLKHNVVPKELEPESLFPGVWHRKIQRSSRVKINRRIEVRNGNEYWSDGKFNFHLVDFHFDEGEQRVLFKKRNPVSGREVLNDLRVIKLGERYEGTENGDKVKYVRVAPS